MSTTPSQNDTSPPAGGYRVTTRLVRGEGSPALEVVETLPDGPRVGAPLLLVHGAFGGAWMWSEHLAPHLARRGRSVVALSLRGHGRSEGGERLRETRLSDYLADVRRVLATLPQTPVVVGHSLGGLIAQRLIGRERMAGLVLMASLPPDGLALVNARTAMTEPLVWLDAVLGSLSNAPGGRGIGPIGAATLSRGMASSERLLFSERLPLARVRRYASMMAPESPRALADAHMPGPVLSAFLTRLPTLVIGGAEDPLVWRACTLRTAFYHAARHETLEACGHFPMLDVAADEGARRLVDWLDRHGL